MKTSKVILTILSVLWLVYIVGKLSTTVLYINGLQLVLGILFIFGGSYIAGRHDLLFRLKLQYDKVVRRFAGFFQSS